MKFTKVAAFAVAAAVVGSGVMVAAPAYAEPVANGYAVVGSDTLQDSMNALTNGTFAGGSRVRVLPPNGSIGNFDAFGSPLVQLKSTGPFFVRPAGSGAGRDALRASISGAAYDGDGTGPYPAVVIAGQIDIARSSSGPSSANVSADGKLAYFQYGRDALAYAYRGDSTALGNITAAQLNQIYTSNVPSTINGVTVTPRIPQSGSGTRNFFLGAIGVTEAQLGTVVKGTAPVPENDGTVIGDNEIIPFSAASFIAQNNGVAGQNTLAGTTTKLGSPLGAIDPYTGSGSALVANPTYYQDATFGRDTYVIVERARVTPGNAAFDQNLANLVDPTKSTSLTNFGSGGSTSGAAKRKFGFLPPSSTTPIYAYVNG